MYRYKNKEMSRRKGDANPCHYSQRTILAKKDERKKGNLNSTTDKNKRNPKSSPEIPQAPHGTKRCCLADSHGLTSGHPRLRAPIALYP